MTYGNTFMKPYEILKTNCEIAGKECGMYNSKCD